MRKVQASSAVQAREPRVVLEQPSPMEWFFTFRFEATVLPFLTVEKAKLDSLTSCGVTAGMSVHLLSELDLGWLMA